MLRIIHRVQNGEVMERLVSLDGSGREFIRTGTELACYLPDKRTVLVERRPEQRPLLGNFPTFDASSDAFYDVQELKRTRFLRRDTRVIAVSPKDEFRYGYRLWIDEATAMPLRTELCDGRGRVIEQLVVTDLKLPRTIPDSAFKPDVTTDGFNWLRTEGESTRTSPELPALWSALQLPPGFRMTIRAEQVMPGSRDPVAHLVFTDGLASVSVFVESHASTGGQTASAAASAQVGSSSVFSVNEDGRKVTAVGEVPLATTRWIANSVKANSPKPAPPSPALSISPPPH